MRMIIVSAGVALILALAGTPLAIAVFVRRGYALPGAAGIGPDAPGRSTPTMGGAVIVIASLIGYLAGHVVTGNISGLSGIEALAVMTGLGLIGLGADIRMVRRQASCALPWAARATPGLDRLQAAAAMLALAGYVVIVHGQLSNCAVMLMRNCYVVRNPLDLAVVAASVLGGCLGLVCWNAHRPKISLGVTGTLALAGVLAGLAAHGDTQVLVAAGGLVVIVTLAVTGWSRSRSAP